MHPDALAFIETQRISVFAIEMMDGTPHASTLHFAHSGDAPTFIFLTERGYRKAEPLLGRETCRGSLVLGFQEGKMQTLQVDGVAQILDESDEELKNAYFVKFPDKQEKFDAADDFFFKFTPTWWRFTDYSNPKGKAIYSSDDSGATQ